jgi:phenylpyruvate tautomerase PptA (4-oxalocrotonate tautomerase family)
MPMIDVFAAAGTFDEMHDLARDIAIDVLEVCGVGDSPVLRQHTATYIHEWPTSAFSNAEGSSDYVRVRVLTAAGSLGHDQKIEMVTRLTARIAAAPGTPPPPDRIWVIVTEAAEGGWGMLGRAYTTAELYALGASPDPTADPPEPLQ